MRIELARMCKGMWRKRGGAGEEMEHAREKRRGREWNGVERREWRRRVVSAWNGVEQCEHTRRWSEASSAGASCAVPSRKARARVRRSGVRRKYRHPLRVKRVLRIGRLKGALVRILFYARNNTIPLIRR